MLFWLWAQKVTGTFEKWIPGLKMSMKNVFWGSEIGSGFEELGGTPTTRIPRSTHQGRNHCLLYWNCYLQIIVARGFYKSKSYQTKAILWMETKNKCGRRSAVLKNNNYHLKTQSNFLKTYRLKQLKHQWYRKSVLRMYFLVQSPPPIRIWRAINPPTPVRFSSMPSVTGVLIFS